MQAQRSSEATLAKDFSSLAIKKLELEFSVDPLFKKASADFDEGGAKGLLLNHLSIDSNGKIVFDSSDDKKSPEELRAELAADDEGTPHPDPQPQKDPGEQEGDEDVEIDIAALAFRFFPDLARLDNMDVCPSLKAFDLGDPAGSLDIPFLKALEERGEDLASTPPSEVGDAFSGGNEMGFGSDDGFGVGVGGDTLGFGEGGEVWANETIADAAERFMSPAKRPLLGMGGAEGEDKFGETGGGDYNVGFGSGHEDVLSYFDEALKKNWAGPEHWRIRKIKDNSKPTTAPVRARKEKESFEIDFMSPAADVSEDVLRPSRSRAIIDLPKKDWKTKSRHLLPDDKHFNSRQLLKLFLKPKAFIQSSKRRRLTLGHSAGNRSFAQEPAPGEDMDEEFWAKEGMAMDIQASSTPDPKMAGNYDANFFQDDGLDMGIGMRDDDDDDDEFADAREAFSPGPDGKGAALPPMGTLDPGGTQFPASTFGGMEFGSQLVTSNRRVRPEYVQYARVAKKVDVRKLKENLWMGLAFETAAAEIPPMEEGAMDIEVPPVTRKFTTIMNELQNVYPQKAMSDISTSYCFICLLHLANEKGLVIEGSEALTELSVTVDTTAEGPDEF